MKRAMCGVVVFIIVAGLVAGLVATHFSQSGGPVYTVDTVVSGLHQQPTVWAGRTILVRGAIIWYEAWYWDPQQQGFSEDGCTDDRYPTVSACQRSISWDLAHLQPGSTVRLVIAPQACLFTDKATGEEIVPQSPSGATVEEIVPQTLPGAMVVRFHVPPGGWPPPARSRDSCARSLSSHRSSQRGREAPSQPRASTTFISVPIPRMTGSTTRITAPCCFPNT